MSEPTTAEIVAYLRRYATQGWPYLVVAAERLAELDAEVARLNAVAAEREE